MTTDSMEICVVLDRSGSMQFAKADHEGGLRSFIEDQQKLEGDVRFTLIQFDTADPHEVVYDGVPIETVDEVQLIPRGGTPLLDAVGMAIAKMATRIGGLEEKPDQVLFLVITDGQENSSHEYDRERVQSMTKEYEDKGWIFTYLGANVDEFAEAAQLGVAAGQALGFANTAGGVKAAYRAVGSNARKARSTVKTAKASGQSVNMEALKGAYAYTDEQRASAKAETPKTPEDEKGAT